MADIVSTTVNTGIRQAKNLANMFIPLVIGTIVIGVISGMMS